MDAIILDENSLIKYPNLLSLKVPNADIFITTAVLSRLDHLAHTAKGYSTLSELVHNAIDAGTIVLHPISEEEVNDISMGFNKKNYAINYLNKTLIVLALFLTRAYENIFIATVDNWLQTVYKELNLSVMDEVAIRKLLAENKSTRNVQIEFKVKQYKSSVNYKFYLGIISGVLASGITFGTYANFKKILETINIWGTIIAAIFLGIILFVFREKQRFGYGVFEFLSGIGAIILIFYPTFNYSTLTYSMDFFFKLLGGLYIMVRGQDNIIKSLQGKKWGLWIKQKTGIG